MAFIVLSSFYQPALQQNPCMWAASTQYFLSIQRQQDSVKDLSAMLWITVLYFKQGWNSTYKVWDISILSSQMSFIESRLKLR